MSMIRSGRHTELVLRQSQSGDNKGCRLVEEKEGEGEGEGWLVVRSYKYLNTNTYLLCHLPR